MVSIKNLMIQILYNPLKGGLVHEHLSPYNSTLPDLKMCRSNLTGSLDIKRISIRTCCLMMNLWPHEIKCTVSDDLTSLSNSFGNCCGEKKTHCFKSRCIKHWLIKKTPHPVTLLTDSTSININSIKRKINMKFVKSEWISLQESSRKALRIMSVFNHSRVTYKKRRKTS